MKVKAITTKWREELARKLVKARAEVERLEALQAMLNEHTKAPAGPLHHMKDPEQRKRQSKAMKAYWRAKRAGRV